MMIDCLHQEKRTLLYMKIRFIFPIIHKGNISGLLDGQWERKNMFGMSHTLRSLINVVFNNRTGGEIILQKV